MNYLKEFPYPKRVIDILDSCMALILREAADFGVRRIVLFGSYARFDYKITSDLDLLVLSEEKVAREVRGEIASQAEELGVDVVFYTEEEFGASQCLLVTRIREEGLLLWKN